jgi:GTPase SAR1 family protein
MLGAADVGKTSILSYELDDGVRSAYSCSDEVTIGSDYKAKMYYAQQDATPKPTKLGIFDTSG